MKTKCCFLIILVLYCVAAFSQKEVYNWYFGKNRGINFNTPSPTLLSNNTMNTWEGCASISDNCTGELLFYTNGITVWDRNHNQMPNGTGLKGGATASGLTPSSTTQSSIIVPKADNKNIYYIFTNDCSENKNAAGFRYSIVDMSLNGGMGDVTTKNTLLLAPGTEKVSAVHHSNKKDIWVVTHGKDDNKFYAYLVSSSGVGAPVISTAGSVENWTIGYLRISPNGKWIVSCAFTQMTNPTSPTFAELFNFNNTTGIVSNPIYFDGPYYGAEFSPNSKVLYIGYGKKLEQYDLTASNIINSKFSLGIQGDNWWSLQQGPDKKIYGTIGQNSIHVIENPNVIGTGCNLKRKSINLGTNCNMGLTNFVVSFFDSSMYIPRNGLPPASINSSGNCIEQITSFSLTPSVYISVDSLSWNFGDYTSGNNNYSNLINPTHTYTAPGNYNVQVVRHTPCGLDTTHYVILIRGVIKNFIPDTTLCFGEVLNLSIHNTANSILWNDGSTSSNFNIISPGSYWVEITDECGINKDSATVSFVDCESTIFIPNAFSPNSTINENKLFKIQGSNLRLINLKIFNRWGEIIFETNSLDNGWDGTYNGNLCQQDVYVWKISYRSTLSQNQEINDQERIGHVSLLR